MAGADRTAAISRFDSGHVVQTPTPASKGERMHTEFTDLIDVMDQRPAAMQTDIDAALDAHQALTRARNLLADVGGTAKASHWPALVEAATKTVFTAANPAVVNLPVNGVAPAPKAKATPVGPKLATRKKAATSGRKVDTEHWAAVAAWIVAAKVDGRYAINNNEKTGVWGGRSERARRAIRRRAFGGAA